MSDEATGLETTISWILIGGVLSSLAFETIGLLANYVQTGETSVSFTSPWNANSKGFFSFVYSTVSSTMVAPSAINIVSLGVILLMLTPYIRVVISVFYFALRKDPKYFAITLIVLTIITSSLLAL